MNRLNHTANSHKAIGVESRHHRDNIGQPDKSMTFSEGDALIRSILLEWLAQKEQELVDNNIKLEVEGFC